MGVSPLVLRKALNITKGGAILAERLEVADTSASRRRGLLGRAALRPGEGLYLTPCEWLHTFGMQFSIDIAFLDSSGRVLAVHHSLRPRRLSRLVWRACGALELPTGVLRATSTERGDVVHLLNAQADECSLTRAASAPSV